MKELGVERLLRLTPPEIGRRVGGLGRVTQVVHIDARIGDVDRPARFAGATAR